MRWINVRRAELFLWGLRFSALYLRKKLQPSCFVMSEYAGMYWMICIHAYFCGSRANWCGPAITTAFSSLFPLRGGGLTGLPPNGGTPHSLMMLTAGRHTSDTTWPQDRMGTIMCPTDRVPLCLKIYLFPGHFVHTVLLNVHVLCLWALTPSGSPNVGKLGTEADCHVITIYFTSQDLQDLSSDMSTPSTWQNKTKCKYRKYYMVTKYTCMSQKSEKMKLYYDVAYLV